MRRIFFFSILLLILFNPGFANQRGMSDPWSSYDWPFEQLPGWETKAEKLVPPSGMERITPPPTMPVQMQPEFAPCEGVVMRYPFGFGNQPFLGMVDALQEAGVVYMLVENAAVQSDLYNYLTSNNIPWFNIECIYVQTDAIWTRDYGPWFVWEDDSTMSIVDMIYYASRPHDDFVPEFLETYWDLGYYGPDIDHEGGNMMTDGFGTMMMSTHVFEANPGWTPAQVNQIYDDYFGQDTTYIFERIQYDATGHIDLWSKIMNDTTILVAQMQPEDTNYQLVENHAARMDQIPTAYGGTFNIVRCPMPPVQWYWIFSYYKSYINSLLFNNVALVPIYGLQWDNEALVSYQQALGPGWQVIGIDCNSIAWAGGAIHCTTIGVPRHDWDYLVDVDFTFNPVNPPIVIPAGGGNFQVEVGIENLQADTIMFDFWVDVTLPNGNNFGPLLQRTRINLPGLMTVGRQLTQVIPANAPAGNYTYRGFVGSYLPLVVSAQDSFYFTKLGAFDGTYASSDWEVAGWEVESAASAISASLPVNFKLRQNFPNPFNNQTNIPFSLRNPAEIELAIYDVEGRLVEILAEGVWNAGMHNVAWNATNLASGVYFYSLKVGDRVQVKKCMLIK